MSKNVFKKLCGVLSVAGILALNSTSAFAFSAVPAAHIPDETINTKIEMGRSNQVITPVIAKNIPSEEMNTKVEMGRNSQDNITPVIAKNIPAEKIDTKVPFNH